MAKAEIYLFLLPDPRTWMTSKCFHDRIATTPTGRKGLYAPHFLCIWGVSKIFSLRNIVFDVHLYYFLIGDAVLAETGGSKV